MADSQTRVTTGQTDFSGGCNSDRVPTIASEQNPNGLPGNCLAWAVNASMRGGGIFPRKGWKRLGVIRQPGLFQEAHMYAPLTGLPYIMAQISGRTYQVRVDLDGMPVNDVTIAGDPNDTATTLNWMCQGERFLIIQDGVHLPLIWDGASLSRSAGAAQSLGVVAVAAVTPAVGVSVLVTLTAPFAGQSGDLVYINGATFRATTDVSQFITVNRAGGPQQFPGSLIKAGASFGTLANPADPLSLFTGFAETIADFTVPLSGAPVNVPVTPNYTGVIPNNNVWLYDRYGGYGGWTQRSNLWNITAVGAAAPGANQVYLINLTGTQGDAIAVDDVLETAAELPIGTCMDYYMGRLWVANGREYLAGDIVGSVATPTSGSPQYGYTDSILHITENSYLSLGGTFLVPTQSGNIRALNHPANLDTALGQGQLLALTQNTIYTVNVVPERAAWATLSEPIQRVAQITFGSMGHRSLTQVNGDLFYQSYDGVRSLQQSIRYFGQWGNTNLSAEEDRAIKNNDKELLLYGSGIEFDGRLLQTCLPQQVTEGVLHKALMPLDFNPISAMGQRGQPVWEGIYQGLDFLQILRADYNGKQRAFGVVHSNIDSSIEVWELTADELFDTNREGEARIRWSFETPSYTWGREFDLKQLDTMEMWIDQLYGTVDFTVEFRPDASPCWYYWAHWQECAPRDACELPSAPVPCVYPQQPYKKQYRAMMTLPKPPSYCSAGSGSRPINIGYSFQFRVTIHGYCRVRGLVVHAFERDRQAYANKVC